MLVGIMHLPGLVPKLQVCCQRDSSAPPQGGFVILGALFMTSITSTLAAVLIESQDLARLSSPSGDGSIGGEGLGPADICGVDWYRFFRGTLITPWFPGCSMKIRGQKALTKPKIHGNISKEFAEQFEGSTQSISRYRSLDLQLPPIMSCKISVRFPPRKACEGQDV